MIVMRVTVLTYGPSIVDRNDLHEVPWMLLLALIARLLPCPAEQSDQGILPWYPALGHLGLTVIALVYVLVVMWQG